ncbi:MAG: twin-arginine translocation signal domain-containing protein [Planctomycetaceae bacterium]|jgi:hypothetical protein|nr:twin-arginine translocation signal domain-containing protein [Planctomycetaceae bacterium]
MSNQTERRDFLKTVGVASIMGGLGETARSQENEQSIKGSAGKETLAEHPFELMICDYVRFKLFKIDMHGKIVWEHSPQGKVWDFVVTDDNEVIFPIITDKQEIRCIDFQKNVKWSWPYAKEYREIINITKHKSQLIVSGQMPPEAILMGLDGTIQKRLPIPAKYNHHHGQLGNVYAVGDNHYLAQLWGEGTALEVDENGKEVWRYQVPKTGNGRYPEGTIQDLLRLQNGNTLLACGTQARLLEVDRKGKIVWEFTGARQPEINFTNACNLQQLQDGSILVTNFLRGNSGRGAHAFRLSTEKEITWTFSDHKNFTAASRVWAIER